MADTTFVTGTPIDHTWLNDVNDSVYSISNVKLYGAIGDGVVDDTLAIQATIDAVVASPFGGVVYLPIGAYKVTANLNLVWPKLCVIRGAGSKLSTILDYRNAATAGATGGCITYNASASAGSDDAYMSTWTGGFTLTKKVDFTVVTPPVISSYGIGAGLYLNGVVGGVYQDIIIHGYEFNIYGKDILGFVMRDMYLNQCKYGVYLAGSFGLSDPTASSIENVIASACGLWAYYVVGGNIRITGGTVSDCGTNGSTSGGISIQNSGVLPLAKYATIDNIWFERNRGTADILIDSTASSPTAFSVSVNNAMFSRLDSTYFTLHNIYVSAVGNCPIQLATYSNGYKHYGAYTPNAGRKYISTTGAYASLIKTSFVGDTYTSAVETPVLSDTAATFSSIGFGATGAALVDVGGVPYLYTPGATIGLGNSSTYGMLFTTTAWRATANNTFDLGANSYAFKDAYIFGNIEFSNSGSIYAKATGANLDLCGMVAIVPGWGISPATNNTYYTGGIALRWANVYSVLGNFSGAITWGSYSIPVPPGGGTTYLRDDGTWATPSAGVTAIDYSYTGTATGFTGSVTGTITYTRIGNLVTLNFVNFTGTSNATTFTITGGPTTMRPASALRLCIVSVGDNGLSQFGIVRVMTTGTIEVYAGAGALPFTASGTKALYEGSISYTVV